MSGDNMQWQPIETLPLRPHCNGLFSTSDSVLFSVYFHETGVRKLALGRVWQENGKRSIVDTNYVDYERVTHWMPLPTPPETV